MLARRWAIDSTAKLWPGGRTNHYWFDLNRDWLPAQQPESQNRLRALSKLGVVQLTHGSEVLLPRDVPGVVEHQGAKPDNGLRRDVSRSG